MSVADHRRPIGSRAALEFLKYLMADNPVKQGGRTGLELQNFRDRHSQWASNPKIAGFGFIEGKFYSPKGQKQQQVVIYAEGEDDRAALERRLPNELSVGSEKNRAVVPVEVVNIGEVTFSSRPARPGAGISRLDHARGTFGMVVRRRSDPEDYILSCAHVLAPYGAGTPADVILEPAQADGGTPETAIGTFYQASTIVLTDSGYPNLIDAALARAKEGQITDDIMHVGRPNGFSKHIVRGMQVIKSGSTSQLSTGVILDPNASIRLPYQTRRGSSARAGFADVVICTSFSQSGDSGAAVLSNKNKVVGVLMAGSSVASVFCKIVHVISHFDLEIA